MADNKSQGFKSPPTMRNDLPYIEWKQELEIWSDFTDLSAGRQGGALFLTLTGKARQAVLAGVSRLQLKSDNGVKEITDCLDELYLKDKSQSGFTAYEDFTNYRRPSHISIQDYLVEFNLKYSRLKTFDMKLPEGILAYYVLKCANLTEEQSNICRATCSSLTYKDMRSQIEKVTSNTNTSCADTSHGEEQAMGVQTQFYGYEHVEDSDPYEVDEDEDSPYDTFYSKNQSYRSQYAQPTTSPSSSKPRLNPPDEFGNTTQCTFCHSTYHWRGRCPDAARSSSAPRRNAWHRRPGRGRGGQYGRGTPSYDRPL